MCHLIYRRLCCRAEAAEKKLAASEAALQKSTTALQQELDKSGFIHTVHHIQRILILMDHEIPSEILSKGVANFSHCCALMPYQ